MAIEIDIKKAMEGKIFGGGKILDILKYSTTKWEVVDHNYSNGIVGNQGKIYWEHIDIKCCYILCLNKGKTALLNLLNYSLNFISFLLYSLQ